MEKILQQPVTCDVFGVGSQRGGRVKLQTRSDLMPQVISDYCLHTQAIRQDKSQNFHLNTSVYRIENEICNHHGD